VDRVTIAAIVEGDGEVRAVPTLLRRIGESLSVWNLHIPTPYRMPRSRLLVPGTLENAVQASAHHVRGAGGILVLIDADDDCPASLGPKLCARAQAARPDMKTAVVLANREYEGWFLASASLLAGRRNLSNPLAAPAEPEKIRGAKEWLSGSDGRPFLPDNRRSGGFDGRVRHE
jgi:hypothetical protein